eukprot:705925-Prorocentrum_minimum.AAC.1
MPGQPNLLDCLSGWVGPGPFDVVRGEELREDVPPTGQADPAPSSYTAPSADALAQLLGQRNKGAGGGPKGVQRASGGGLQRSRGRPEGVQRGPEGVRRGSAGVQRAPGGGLQGSGGWLERV